MIYTDSFPCTAWRLTPSFKPTTVQIVREYSAKHPEWVCSDTGRLFDRRELFDTQEAAIAAGRDKLDVMGVKARKLVESMSKKSKALYAAERALQKGGAK